MGDGRVAGASDPAGEGRGGAGARRTIVSAGLLAGPAAALSLALGYGIVDDA